MILIKIINLLQIKNGDGTLVTYDHAQKSLESQYYSDQNLTNTLYLRIEIFLKRSFRHTIISILIMYIIICIKFKN